MSNEPGFLAGKKRERGGKPGGEGGEMVLGFRLDSC